MIVPGFWMGGFEGADHVNAHGQLLDMSLISGHVQLLEQDYARVRGLGLRSVRESVGWRRCSAGLTAGHYDLRGLRRALVAARTQGIEIMWTLMHYGMPEGVELMGSDFPERFQEFAALVARETRASRGIPSVYTPINEIGFLAWAYTQSHLVGGRRGRDLPPLDGFEVKCRLVSAALAATAAIRREDPGAILLQIEPLIHVVAAPECPEFGNAAATFTDYQWQAWDMVMGRTRPELGGNAQAVDAIGVNHYHDAQWELPSGRPLEWNPPHLQRRDFALLLEEAWLRYKLPMLVAETGHVGEGRAAWLEMMVNQTRRAMQRGVPVSGFCLYPLVDRPDWNDASHWHHSGLWDAGVGPEANLVRDLALPYARALRRCAATTGLRRSVATEVT